MAGQNNELPLKCNLCGKTLRQLDVKFNFPRCICCECNYREIIGKRPDDTENREKYYKKFENFGK